MKKFFACNLALFSIGGILYGMVEVLWRSYTHWSMLLTGGTCFTVLYRLFQKMRFCSLWYKCLTGSMVITAIELMAGYLFNIRMKLQVWDYSRQPLNFCGQVCPLYSFFWGILTLPILGLCRWLDRNFKL